MALIFFFEFGRKEIENKAFSNDYQNFENEKKETCAVSKNTLFA